MDTCPQVKDCMLEILRSSRLQQLDRVHRQPTHARQRSDKTEANMMAGRFGIDERLSGQHKRSEESWSDTQLAPQLGAL